ncbi:MAG TPA: thiamine phosphate synthase [Clostridia bacterium]|nr:thiamine phosphate synthase [Clostridia bacterium]
MKPDLDCSLYLVTDRNLMRTPTLSLAVEQAIQGGCTLIQLREKTVSSLEFYRLAEEIKIVTDRGRVPLVINDRVDIALAVGAAGVHIGQNDLPAGVVRSLLGTDQILGVSVETPEQAVRAERDGADYLGVGAMFATGTKSHAGIVTMESLKVIRAAVTIPIVVIGGIGPDTIPLFDQTGIDGIAVVSALMAADDIARSARELKKEFSKLTIPSEAGAVDTKR